MKKAPNNGAFLILKVGERSELSNQLREDLERIEMELEK
jgi:hypothetical protein